MNTMNLVRAAAALLASGFGSGYARIAPGTCGSVAALFVWWLLYLVAPVGFGVSSLVLLAVATVIGLIAVVGVVGLSSATNDPQWIVIDEWAGLYLALFGLSPVEWRWVVVAFVLFRVLDAVKIGPVGWAESLPGAWGIMADDLVAGALAALVLWGLRVVL
jgi:phosphatidylglycerophosphatase A